MLQPQPSPATHESAFIERYDRLYKSALTLTKQNQEQAEDLLHDAFVQFLLSHPDLQSIQNLDGYLYRVLRNMRVSQMRRATRLQEATLTMAGSSLENILSLPDHSSLESGLNSIEQRAHQQVQDELRRICQYAAARKASSKAGSIVMLRFFLGYYPEEIAQILKSPRATIDKALQRARGEARLYLAEPDSLSFIRGNSKSETLGEVESGKTLSEFLQNLRAAVYSAGQDPCLSIKTIRGWYVTKPSASTSGPDTKALSHVVSCPKCLDEINRTLGLPLLATRHPAEMGRRDPRKPRKGGKDGGGASGGASGGGVGESFLDRSRKRLKEAFEHRPQELRICVNGFLLGSQRINAELNEQTLSIKGEDKVGFVEVFSEREVRLLFYCVESPPDGPVEHHQRVDLSGGRSVELSLDFSAESPSLEVLYRDPNLATEEVVESDEIDNAYSAIEPADSKPTLLTDLKLRSASLIKRLLEGKYWLRPATVTALLALVLFGSLTLLYRRAPTTPVTAASLLQRASAAEEADAARVDQVLHRTISLEERRVGQTASLSSDDLIAKRKIEIWQSAERGITARRLYDDRGQLIAGDWRRADGVQTLYHHGSQPKLQLAPEKRGAVAQQLNFDNVWQVSLSAKEFSSLIADSGLARVEERDNSFVITYGILDSFGAQGVSIPTRRDSDRVNLSSPKGDRDSTESASLVKASLILSKSDLHAIAQTLVVRQRNEERIFHYLETSFERRPMSAVAPAVFEPDPMLVGADTRVDSPPPVSLGSSLSPPFPAATAAVEVEVLRLLNSVGADLGEQINIRRTPEGELRIEGVVETRKRKDEILKALQPVSASPAVKVDLQTVEEAAKRTRQREQTGAAQVEREETASDKIPADADLRRFLSARGVGSSQLDDEVRSFAGNTLRQSNRVMRHAWALKSLADRFSEEDIRGLDDEARAKWRSLIRSHAAALRHESVALRQKLGPVFPAANSGAAVSGSPVSDDDDLIRAVRELFGLCSASDRVIRSAFSVSSDAARADAVKSQQFGRDLKSIETLAAKLAGQ